MESPRSLIARIKEERAKERQWQKETARRKKKYQLMKETVSLAQQEGQLTTIALESHNKEKVRKARLHSFSKRQSGSQAPTAPSATSNYTYGDSLSRIETASTCSAVPLSLLGVVPPSTAAGQIRPSCNLLAEKLSVRKKRVSAPELETDGWEVHQEEPKPQMCSPNVQREAAPTPVRQQEPELSHSANGSVLTKSVKEFLVLEKQAHTEKAEHQSPAVKSLGAEEAAGPTIFSVLPAIQNRRMNLPPPPMMDMAPATKEVDQKKATGASDKTSKVEAPKPFTRSTTAPNAKIKRRSNSQLPPVHPRRPNQPINVQDAAKEPKGIMKPFLRRAESAKRMEPSVTASVTVDNVNVFRPGSFSTERDTKRGVQFDMAAGGDVFTANDGVQFNVLRSMQCSMSASGSGQGAAFAAAIHQAQQHTAEATVANQTRSLLFGQPRPDLFEDDDEDDYEPPAAIVPTSSTNSYASNFARQQQNEGVDDDSALSAENDITGNDTDPASTRHDDVIPTGFSMEERALMAALNNINRKQLEHRGQVAEARAKKQNGTSASGCPIRTLVPNSAVPVSHHKATPMKQSRRTAGGRRHIGVQPL